jgi:3-hydroxybutyryl-CoA dehydratase
MTRRFADLAVGQSAERSRVVTDALVRGYAELTGDFNPLHLDDAVAARTQFGGRIAHGMLSAGFLSAVIAMDLPGSASVWLSQTIRFTKPVRIGDTVTARVEVTELIPAKKRLKLATTCRNQAGETVLEGEALIQMMDESA